MDEIYSGAVSEVMRLHFFCLTQAVAEAVGIIRTNPHIFPGERRSVSRLKNG